jgi:hypothetical protein
MAAGASPWEKYQSPDQNGPWAKYAQSSLTRDPSQPTEFEKERTDVAAKSPVSRFGSAAWGATKGLAGGLLEMGENAMNPGRTVANAVGQFATEDINRKQMGRSVPYRAVAGLGSMLGVPAAQMEERADVGDTAGVLGAAAPITAAAVASPFAPKIAESGFEAARDFPGRASEAVRVRPQATLKDPTPTGKLKPWARVASHGIGAAGGYLAGEGLGTGGYGGYAGGALGYRLGPQLLDSLLPRHPNPIPIPSSLGSELGAVGSEVKEAGWQPATTKVPIRSEPPYKLTPESVPGPDTAGKGNLLTPLAKTGDPRAAAELMRRGRRVLYVPAESYPEPKSTTRFP